MGTVADNKAYALETKELIKQALIAKGAVITDETTFREYAAIIAGFEVADNTIEDWLISDVNTPEEYANDRVTEIASYAFYAKTLGKMRFENVKYIRAYAFAESNVSEIELPNVTSIGEYAFRYCEDLKPMNFSNVTTIERYAFFGAGKIGDVEIPKLASLPSGAFYQCELTRFSAPLLVNVESTAFNGCADLIEFSATQLTSLGGSAFNACTNLTSVNIPLVTVIANSTFQKCSALGKLDLPAVTSIEAKAFNSCSALETLILRSETVCTLGATSAFNSTPIASGTGYIYVPSAIIEEYKVATNWSIYADQFRAIEDYPDICGGK